MELETFSFFSSSDENDEMDLEALEYLHVVSGRPYTLRPRVDHFSFWDDNEFVVRFRLDKETVKWLVEFIRPAIYRKKKNAIKPESMLLLALRYYASGCMLVAAGDFFGVSKSTACIIVKEVSSALAQLARIFIKMPSNEEEIRTAQLQFFRKARLPRTIAAIDCTHVRIQSPGGLHAESFRNRKGYFSINVQTASSADLRILDIVARWPGSAHDQTIFNSSNLKRRLESGEFGNSIIVADCGYANTKYIMTPFVRTNNRAEQLFNEAVIRTRNVVERQYGVWKRRFPVIAYGMRVNIKNAQTIILATAVLHNIAIDRKLPGPPTNEEVERKITAAHIDATPIDSVNNGEWTARESILPIFQQ